MGKRQAIHQSEQRRLKVIKKVSNEELIEKFMLHVPQSVVGTSFPPSVIKATQNEIETLRTQLAKANERISQYESKQDKGADLLIKLAKSNASMASLELELAKANERVRELEKGNRACAIAIRELIARGDIEPLMVGNEALDKIVNKFAIEKKIEALTSLIEHEASTFRLHNGNKRSGVFSIDIKHEIEALKLRKEQNQC